MAVFVRDLVITQKFAKDPERELWIWSAHSSSRPDSLSLTSQ